MAWERAFVGCFVWIGLWGCSSSSVLEDAKSCAEATFTVAYLTPADKDSETRVYNSRIGTVWLTRTVQSNGSASLIYQSVRFESPLKVIQGTRPPPDETPTGHDWMGAVGAGSGFILVTSGTSSNFTKKFALDALPANGPAVRVAVPHGSLLHITGMTELPDCNCALVTRDLSADWPVETRAFVVDSSDASVIPWGSKVTKGDFILGYPAVIHGEIVGTTHLPRPGGKEGYAWFDLKGKQRASRLWNSTTSSMTWVLPVETAFAAGPNESVWVARGITDLSFEFMRLHLERYDKGGRLAAHIEYCDLGIVGLASKGMSHATGGVMFAWAGADGSRNLSAWDLAGRRIWTKPFAGQFVGQTFGLGASRILRVAPGNLKVTSTIVDAWGRIGCDAKKECGVCEDGKPCTIDDCNSRGECVYHLPLGERCSTDITAKCSN